MALEISRALLSCIPEGRDRRRLATAVSKRQGQIRQVKGKGEVTVERDKILPFIDHTKEPDFI